MKGYFLVFEEQQDSSTFLPRPVPSIEEKIIYQNEIYLVVEIIREYVEMEGIFSSYLKENVFVVVKKI